MLGEHIVAQCKGLPLAIVVLGALLAPKETPKEWRSVQQNVKKLLSSNNDEENVRVQGVLGLSYSDLPYHLRPCFLHLGSFPIGFEIPTKKLYRMWIAEGIVAPRDDTPVNLETIANSYLQELVQRCIVQVGKRGPAGKIKTCRLHDLMWEMCTSKANEENFLSIVRQENRNVCSDDYSSGIRAFGKLHRVAIHFGQSLQTIVPYLQSNEASHLRSLMFFSSGGSVNNGDQGWLKATLNECKLLRVLNLEDTGIDKVPKEIGTLIHLRYLSIMGTRVRVLPSSIGRLRCLQTLDLRVLCLPDNCAMRIPDVLWRLKRLKHLHFPAHPYNCTVMRIPNVLTEKFRKLRTNGLSNLEIMKNFDTRICQVRDLCQLEKLRKLAIKNKISKTETLKTITEYQSIKDHKLVRLSLEIHCSILEQEAAILSSFSCLHTLKLSGTKPSMTELRLGNVIFPSNLAILDIKNCKVMCVDPFNNIKQLPNLTSLSLNNVEFSGNCMDCSGGGFLQLVHLELSDMETLKEWRVRGNTMPKLYRLQIHRCGNLETIPDGLPTAVQVVCYPCVNGISKYFTCPYQQVEIVDDDDDDLATKYCTMY